MPTIIDGSFPISEEALEKMLVEIVGEFWGFSKNKGVSAFQAAFYVEQALNRPMETAPVAKALVRLESRGEICKMPCIQIAKKMNLSSGKTIQSRFAADRYFPKDSYNG